MICFRLVIITSHYTLCSLNLPILVHVCHGPGELLGFKKANSTSLNEYSERTNCGSTYQHFLITFATQPVRRDTLDGFGSSLKAGGVVSFFRI